MLSITSIAAEAIPFGRSLQNDSKAIEKLHEKYKNLPPVHTINNLALVVWGLLAGEDDLIKAIGQTVAARGNTDCNGAAAGGFWGLSGKPIPNHWTNPWQGKVMVTIAGVGELKIDDLIDITIGCVKSDHILLN